MSLLNVEYGFETALIAEIEDLAIYKNAPAQARRVFEKKLRSVSHPRILRRFTRLLDMCNPGGLLDWRLAGVAGPQLEPKGRSFE